MRMENHDLQVRKRRRRQDKAPVKARLVLDECIEGHLGLISQDLFAELFPAISQDQESGSLSENHENHYVAIALCELTRSVENTAWNIVPIKPSSNLPNSTIKFSPGSTALQSFSRSIQNAVRPIFSSHDRKELEIMVLDVFALILDTVYVSIERDTARRLENGEGKVGVMNTQLETTSTDQSDSSSFHLSLAIRKALGPLLVVHTDDLITFPLQPHPITHMPPPPARVIFCEPVLQGILSPHSRIIVTMTRQRSSGFRNPRIPVAPMLKNFTEEDEDTSNDQFFSATEDRGNINSDSDDDDDNTKTETETGITSADDDLSDDLMDDIISLQAPLLSSPNPSGTLTLIPGTPQTVKYGRLDGLSTPGSVFSTLTATVGRTRYIKRSLFKTQALLCPISEDIIFPKPNSNDDDEARIFVDTRSLTRIGCFSGDWVRFEAASEPSMLADDLLALENYGAASDDLLWRPVKIFGLPESHSRQSNTRVISSKYRTRKSSFFESQTQKPQNHIAYLSPILLANVENAPYCRISKLDRGFQSTKITSLPKIVSKSRPPIVRDLGLVKISTPFSSERIIQNALFSGLQRFFSSRTRIVRKGDFVAIGIDENLAKILYTPSPSEDPEYDDNFTSAVSGSYKLNSPSKPTGVAWFRINYVGVTRDVTVETNDEDDIWGGIVSVDAASTRISQSGSENCRLPSSMDNPWEYYLGLRTSSRAENSSNLVPEYKSPPTSIVQRRLRELASAATSPRAIHLQSSPLTVLISSTQRNIGKTTVAQRALAEIGLHCLTIDAYDILTEEGSGNDVKMAALFETRAERAMSCGVELCGLLIRHIEVFSADRIISSLNKVLEGIRVLIATTTDIDKIPKRIRGVFTHELEMTAPDEGDRQIILKNILDTQPIALAPNVDLSLVAIKTAALVAGDLVDVVDRALVARMTRLERLASKSSNVNRCISVRDILVSGGSNARCINKPDFDVAVDAARKNFADAIGAPKIPNVTWDDVGGLANVKNAVMETIQLPLERPELFTKGMKKRSGILFYGPPGTGKTLLAKAIATEFSLNFFSVKGPELLNMYIGESEANVRRVFQRARDARPCVVFFDELDSVAPKRGNQGDSGGVMDRIVSQLLAELDGMSSGEDGSGGVFVIGATNRPDLLDPALLRPGRFDKMLYLGVSETREKQLTIMEALTRKFSLHPDLSLEHFVSRLPFTYTGADFYALCSDAMLNAITRQSSKVDHKISEINAHNSRLGKKKISTAYFFDHFATDEDVSVTVTEEDFCAAERELIPSVSAKELENYQRVRARFEKVEDESGAEADHQSEGKGKGKGKIFDTISKERQEFASLADEKNNEENMTHGNRKGKGKGKVSMKWSEICESSEKDLY